MEIKKSPSKEDIIVLIENEEKNYINENLRKSNLHSQNKNTFELPKIPFCKKKFKIEKPDFKKENLPLFKKILKSNLKIKNQISIDRLKHKRGRGGGPKIYKKRLKSHREDIYNINNFIIHPNQIKINQVAKNSQALNIMTPNFKNTFDFDDEKSVKAFSFSSVEDTSDEAYHKYHDQYEKRERDYRQEIYGGYDKKKKKENNLKKNNSNSKLNLETSKTDSSEGCYKIRIEIDNNKSNFK